MTSEENRPPAKAWYLKKRVWITTGAALALALLILVSLPYGIQFGLADFLEQHGARQVQIRNIDFNPFTGRLLFEEVMAESADEDRLRLDRLELILAWRDLFSKRARVQAIDLEGLQASVDLSDPASLWVSGLVFPLGESAEEAAGERPEEGTPWGFALDSVELRACKLKLRQRDLAFDIALAQLRLQRVISWQLQQVAELSLEGEVNGAALNAGLQAVLFDETREIEGEVRLQGFELGALQPLLSEGGGPELNGQLDLEQTFKLRLKPTQAVSWEADGVVSGSKLNTAAAEYQGRELANRWQGKSSGGWSAQDGLTLRLDGQLEGALPGFKLPPQAIDLALAGYRWQGQIELAQAATGTRLKADGALALEQAVVEQAERQPRHLALQRLALQGLSLQLQQTAEGALVLTQQGELDLEGLSVTQHRLIAALSGVQWRGGFSLQTQEAGPEITAEGGGLLEGLRLREEQGDSELVALQRLDLSGVKLAPGNALALDAMALEGIVLGPATGKEASLLSSKKLTLKDIRLAEATGLSVGLVEQQGLDARLQLDKQGRFNLQGVVERLQAAAAAPDEGGAKADSAEAKPMPIKIERLVWQGENRASFSDLSVKPPFEMELEVKKFELTGVDSSRPKKPSPFTFVGSTGRHAEISAEGEITLFQSDPDGRLKGELKGVEMIPLSSYTVPAIGYNLDSGELDAEIELALKQGEMQGNNHLIIRRLDVSQASEAQAEKLKAQISMPLDTALGMLQDKNQTIDLNLPVSGKLSDPNVELGDVINTALGNALKKGAMTYLTTALFPYGTMVALLKMAGEEAGAVRLNPVEFQAAAAELDDQDRDYLGKVAKVLQERPKIAIKLCGSATQSDRQALAEALAQQATKEKKGEQKEERQAGEGEAEPLPQVADEQLLELAKQRAETVEDYLVKEHGVSASQAAVCRPVIDSDKAALPRVDLQI